MPLPININELIHGNTVEWERIELKKGWNPKKVIHSICAYANDFNDWEGGYIIVGVDEENGKAKLPPEGVPISSIDSIQKELLNFCKTKIKPSFVPLLEPYELDGKMILVIWVPAGYEKPYYAATDLGKGADYRIYIKKLSNTVLATRNEGKQLMESAAFIPFVERRNQQASLKNIDRGLITEYLERIGSSLAKDSTSMPIEDLVRRLNIASGPDEALLPRNIGLLFFNSNPEDFFYKSSIEVVRFSDNEGADEFIEKVFSGPLHKQIENALEYIDTNVIHQRVEKVPLQAAALRYFNFPFEAIEEALVNAVYHKSYQEQQSVEVRVYPNRIHILNYPGPLPPISNESMSKGKFNARRYRNPRMGDLLKELGLAEAKGTGVPKIKRAMKNNGSPDAIFETDDERSFFEVLLPIHASFPVKEIKSEEEIEFEIADLKILRFCIEPKSRKEILEELLGITNRTSNYERHVKHLVDSGAIQLTNPDKPTDPNQSYFTNKQLIDHIWASE